MIGIFLGLLIITIAGLIAYTINKNYDPAPETIATVVITTIAMLFIVPLILIPITGGSTNHTEGQSQGYVVQVYDQGIFWVTCRFEMLAGDKDSSILLPGSITDADVKKKATALVGKKVVVKYKRWIIAPFWVGNCAEIYAIEEVE